MLHCILDQCVIPLVSMTIYYLAELVMTVLPLSFRQMVSRSAELPQSRICSLLHVLPVSGIARLHSR